MITLETKHIDISYSASGKMRKILSDFNLQVKKGEMLGVIGPNGAGKSSLLRILSGLQRPSAGEVIWGNKDLNKIPFKQRPQYVSNLFSNYARVDGFKVLDLVALGRQPFTGMFGKLKTHDKEIMEQSLAKVGMLEFKDEEIGTLSDGEFRKAMLAKMLAQQAEIMILDEPTTHLDLPGSVEFLKLLQSLARKEEKTIVFSSHQLGLILKMVKRLVLISTTGEFMVGTVEEVTHSSLMHNFLKTKEVYFSDGNLIFNPK